EPEFKRYGYLRRLDDDGDAQRFAADGAQLLAPAAALGILPQLALDGIVAAAFDERAGYVTPDLVVQAYARRAAGSGAHIEQSCAATRILTSDGRVTGVETARGTIATERVVLAAGVWSRAL